MQAGKQARPSKQFAPSEEEGSEGGAGRGRETGGVGVVKRQAATKAATLEAQGGGGGCLTGLGVPPR